jgi:HlyD family secretion protein
MGIIKKTGGWLWQNKIKFVLLVCLIGGGFYYWQKKQDSTNAENNNKLKTAIVKKGDIEVLVSGSGQVEAQSQVDLRPQVAGDGIDIIEIAVENNQEVKEGDIIAILDTENAQKVLRDARLSLKSSEIKQKQVNDENEKQTKEQKLIRQTQEIDVQQKLNKLADSNDELRDYYIRAPFDGTVTGLDVYVGDSVSRDEILASVITKEMIANISLNEIDAVKVGKGAPVQLSFSALDGVSIKGEVTKIDTIGAVDQGVVSYNAKIAFDASEIPDLKPGMSVEAEIITEAKEDVLSVPVAAIQSNPRGGEFVVVIEKGLSPEELVKRFNSNASETEEARVGMPEGLKRIEVKSGISNDVVVEISGEIAEGDIVLTQTVASLIGTAVDGNEGATSKSLIPTMGRGTGAGMRR